MLVRGVFGLVVALQQRKWGCSDLSAVHDHPLAAAYELQMLGEDLLKRKPLIHVSVGLGKTFTALAVMKYYASRNKNILVLTPKKLANNWNKYRDNVRTNLFQKDRIHFDVLYHTDLGRKKGFSNGHDLAQFNWDNYDLIVIDESHNFRNADSYRDRETRYSFLMNKVLKPGVKTKVLMLSATPVLSRLNTEFWKNFACGRAYRFFCQRHTSF